MQRVTVSDILPNLLSNKPKLQASTIKALHPLVPAFFHEIASEPFMSKLNSLVTSDSLPEIDRKNASLLLSKVYYHLNKLPQALEWALNAGELLDFTVSSPFISTIIDLAITSYTEYRQHVVDEDPVDELTFISPFLEPLFDKIIEYSFEKEEYQDIIGLGFEARRIDIIERSIRKGESATHEEQKPTVFSSSTGNESAKHSIDLKKYCLRLALNHVTSYAFKLQIVKLLADLANEGADSESEGEKEKPKEKDESAMDIESSSNTTIIAKKPKDFFFVAHCLTILDDSDRLANILMELLKEGSQKSLASALQIAFDLHESGTQGLRMRVRKLLANARSTILSSAPSSDSPVEVCFDELLAVISGEIPTLLYLKFLSSRNEADPMDLQDLKTCNDRLSTLLMTGAMISHAIMEHGTICDEFIRANTEWLQKASNWSKFTITASFGMVHFGHTAMAFRLLEQFLPATDATNAMKLSEEATQRENERRTQQGLSVYSGNSAEKGAEEAMQRLVSEPAGARQARGGGGPVTESPYSEAGGLLALSLIYGESGALLVPYLLQTMQEVVPLSANKAVHQHGLCLALGCAAMANGDEGLLSFLRDIPLEDDPNSGLAATVAMGLVMLGTGRMDIVEELMQHARNTPHEKTGRGCGIGIALCCATKQEVADHCIEQLCGETDAVLRYAGVLTAGLAYIGSPKPHIVQRLFKIAATDPNKDVQRQAVVSLGLIHTSAGADAEGSEADDSFPRSMRALCDSFNPHIRAGAALALGFSAAGKPSMETTRLLIHLSEDREGFVRECACIGLGFVFMEKSEKDPKYKDIDALLKKVIEQKKADVLARFGAMIGIGVMNAGGRNCALRLFTAEHTPRLGAIAGMALFSQFWFWHPFLLFLSYALNPTALIGVDTRMRIPSYPFACSVVPDKFGYPPKREREKEKAKEKKKAVELSVTKKKSAMMTPDEKKIKEEKEKEEKEKEEKEKEEKEKEEREKKEAEEAKNIPDPIHPGLYILDNPTRVVPLQQRYIVFPSNEPSEPKSEMDEAELTPSSSSVPSASASASSSSSSSSTSPSPASPTSTAAIAESRARYKPIRTDKQQGILLLLDNKENEKFVVAKETIEELDAEMKPPAAEVYFDDD
ncbi:putative 26S proteasome regulatory subunit N2 [Monocercomonoides exilis]|uniref:putative 26S proteasome regulatory subunit N2 n=1 Tax=Monocercomonoides exilis TaxID=2049356 RepID=UPI003559FE3A|nr:putative 26S proteasome regulatory subunit N2 [Monocercomonoides exilis]|eukprot:MONOS_6451.1-p1 / transcript=MONOS_6451.1 / gene=MONOS_6451 / organism=Monocercomonoides_exilis_PA203 / gene_product=26S proteasome regulatory subunit N2 / transcript_product=26S proteasome regulatory subunit N2 / location=Mono_scaffold00203:18395-22270(+) / protein_length=1127 / sequence_SO=supercontig / SO=protein_coding / is_pseudo=false